MGRILQLAVLLLGALVLSGPAIASGTYSFKQPRPPLEKAGIDKYALGKKIFGDKSKRKPDPNANATQQSERLKELQLRLPENIRQSEDLPRLAGTLSPQELEALEYYLEKRFKIKLPAAETKTK